MPQYLPYEILHLIADWLDDLETLQSFRLVTRACAEAGYRRLRKIVFVFDLSPAGLSNIWEKNESTEPSPNWPTPNLVRWKEIKHVIIDVLTPWSTSPVCNNLALTSATAGLGADVYLFFIGNKHTN